MAKPNIIEAFELPEFFGDYFTPKESWAAWKVFLKALYNLELSKREAKLFTKCTGREKKNDAIDEAYAICARRSGKSRIASFIAVYTALFGDFQEHLAEGETASIFIVAVDRRQSGICLNYCKAFLRKFPDIIERELQDEIILKNSTSIVIQTASFKSSRGYSVALLILDELAFFKNENYTNPAAEIVSAILPSMLENGRVLGLSSPYGKFGYLYQIYKENYSKDSSDILVWQAAIEIMNPAYNKKRLAKMKKRDPIAYKAEFQAEFRSDIETFLSEENLLNITIKDRRMLPPKAGTRYLAFCDPSGGKHDSYSLGISHVKGGKVIEDFHAERMAPFNPKIVTKSFADILKRYGIYIVVGDAFAANWCSSAWREEGIKYEVSSHSKSEIFNIFSSIVLMHEVELLDDERSRIQFQQLERRTGQSGKDSIQKSTGGFDDLCNSVAGSIVFSHEKITTRATMQELENRLPVFAGAPRPSLRKRTAENGKMEQECLKELREEGIL